MSQSSIIVACPLGGLGNQLFNVCAAWITAKHHSLPLYILSMDKTSNKHNHKQRDYTQLLFTQFGTPLPYTFSSDAFHHLRVIQHLTPVTQPSSFYPWSPQDISPNSYLTGYHQYYPPLIPYEHEIRSLIRMALHPFSESLHHRNFSSCAFLHIRRGDYLSIQHIHYVQPLSYYETAVNKLLSINPSIERILILTEDMDWVRQQPFFSLPIFELYNCDDELTTLALMSQCKSGAICANSTFSWWGAFLGAYESRSPVYVPSRWINERVYSLFPPEWIQIE